MTDYCVASLFSRLDEWRHLPAYQLERRADIFFGLFLPEALNHHLRSRGISINPSVIPEFPLRQKTNRRSDKADYFALSTDRKHAFLIELKTDLRSLRDGQEQYLGEARKRGMRGILEDVKYMAQAKNPNSRRKYFHLLRALANLELMGLPPELEHKMYVQPRGVYNCIKGVDIEPVLPKLEVIHMLPKANGKENCIEFKTLANIVEHQGEIGRVFARYLRTWACIEAGSQPDNRPPAQ